LRSLTVCWPSSAPPINSHNVLRPSLLPTNRKSAPLASAASASGWQLDRALPRVRLAASQSFAPGAHSASAWRRSAQNPAYRRHPAQVNSRHQWQHHGMAGSNDRRVQHGMIMRALPVGSLAGKTLRAAVNIPRQSRGISSPFSFLRTEILASIQRQQVSAPPAAQRPSNRRIRAVAR
jgi:hypothetical protein